MRRRAAGRSENHGRRRGVIKGKAGKHLPNPNFETIVILEKFCLVKSRFINFVLVKSHFIKFLVGKQSFVMFLLGKQSF